MRHRLIRFITASSVIVICAVVMWLGGPREAWAQLRPGNFARLIVNPGPVGIGTTSLVSGADVTAATAMAARGYRYADPMQTRSQSVPLANYIGQTIYHETFEATAGFSTTHATLAADTTYVKTGAASVKSVPDGTDVQGNFYKAISPALDMTGGLHGMLRFYVWPGTTGGADDFATITDIELSFFDGTRAVYVKIWSAAGAPQPGWYEVPFVVDEVHRNAGPAGAISWSAITEIDYCVTVSGAGKVPAVTFDECLIYKPRNTKGPILLWEDSAYSRTADFAHYIRSVTLNGSGVVSSRPSLVINVSATTMGATNHCTLAQLKDLIYAGHVVGLYGAAAGLPSWITKTTAQKIQAVYENQDYLAANGLPLARTLTPDGGRSWVPGEDDLLLGRYYYSFVGDYPFWQQTTGSLDRAVTGLYDPRRAPMTSFGPAGALLTRTVTIDADTDVMTLGATVTWSLATGGRNYPHPIKLSAAVLPTGITAGTIYWYVGATNQTGSLYPTAADALAGTNKINFSDTGTTVVATSIDDQYFGKRVYAFVASKGIWSAGFHLIDDNELASAKFQFDAFAALANEGVAQFVTPDELVSGGVK